MYSRLLVVLQASSISLLLLVYQHAVKAFNKDGADNQGMTTPFPFTFSVKQSCDTWVVFHWDSSPEEGFPPDLSSCEITYMNLHTQEVKLGMVILDPDSRTIKLKNLNRATHYTASMTCNETITSGTVEFVTGYPCTEEDMKKVENKLLEHKAVHTSGDNEVFRNPVSVTTANSGYSVTNMVLGLFFALCGTTIAGCVGYYYLKKRRHRQRIQRLFGQSHSDPFLALHTPSDQPTTNF